MFKELLLKIGEKRMYAIIIGITFSIFIFANVFGETPEEKQARILNELEIVKMRNISLANQEIDTRSEEKNMLMDRIQTLDFEMMMYDRCILVRQITNS